MRINISGKHMETGEALKEHVTEHLQNSVKKYFENAIVATVVFSKREAFYNCHIHVNEGVKGGIDVSSEEEAADVYVAFDGAVKKAEKQLRRYKRKLKDRSGKESVSSLSAKFAESA